MAALSAAPPRLRPAHRGTGLLVAALLMLALPHFASSQETPTPAPSAPTAPQVELTPDYLRPLAGWSAALDRVERLLGEPSASDRSLAEAREELVRLQVEADSHLARLKPRLAGTRAEADRFGPAPAAGQSAELPALAQQRRALAETVAGLTGAISAAEAVGLRAANLTERIRDARRAAFQDTVLQRGPSLVSPRLWSEVAQDIPIGLGRLGVIIDDWGDTPDSDRLGLLLLGGLALALLLSYAAWRGILRYRRWHDPEPPSSWRRVASAGWVILLRAAPTLAGAALIHIGLQSWGDALPARTESLIETLLRAVVIVIGVHAVSKTVLAITRPHWRLLGLADRPARQLYHRIMLLALTYGADLIASAVNAAADMPYSLSMAQSFAASLAFAAIIIAILLIRAPAGPGETKARGIGAFYVRFPLWLVATAIFLSAVTGYVALARFIAGQLIVISTILTIAYLFVVWASAFGQSLSDDRAAAGRWMRERLGFERRREQIALPVTLLLQAAILTGAIPFILLQWGFDWHDIGALFRSALFGFQLGDVNISLLGILAALLIFLLGYTGAKIVQAWLDGQVLEPAGVEESVRHSIRTGVGYLGVIIAALLAISYVGLNLSNLAIVAGALSVGIGFGLQSVVNNFVSGLILLAERPIKVGDWVIVGAEEGLVRRISVRSTEIETFERSNVIVPNSQLITQQVKNWTLHNNTGRFPIRVAVHYASDPEQVRDILLSVARAHPQVLSTPEPFVYFEEFGSSALNFTLFVYLANVSRSFSARTDLRIAILKAFRAADIEMPYPQTDVHFRDLTWVKRVVAERLAKGKADEMTIRDFDAESGLGKEGDDGL
jgi:small-conductance mechanosensitive channel